MRFAVVAVLCCIFLNSANGFFLKSRSRNPHSQYGPPKPSYAPPKPSYKPVEKPAYEPDVALNEIDDGYGSPAAPVVSSKPETSYQEPAKTYEEPKKPMYHPPMKPSYHPPPKPMYKMRPPMHRMPSYRKIKMKKPMYMMFPKMPRYKFPKMRFPKFMMMMPKLPKFPRMPMYLRLKPRRPMYGKPMPHAKPVNDHGGYKHMDNLDYSGWTPIGMTHPEPEEPSYNAINESPILTIEDAYNSPSKPVPPLPSGDGYDAPEVITAAPAAPDSYGVPQADPVSYEAPKPVYSEPAKDTYGTPEAPIISYKEPETPQAPSPSYEEPAADTYGKPEAELISYKPVTYAKPVAPAPAYKEPEPAYIEPEKETYGTPLAPLVSYKEPEYVAPQPPPAAPATLPPPAYNSPAPAYAVSPAYAQPTYQPQTTYHQPAYGGYSSPIEEPLFDYAPVSDLNNLAAVAVEDTYQAAAAPPSPGRYQATADASALAEEVQSGSVYVQPNNNLYHYGSYGEKIPTSNQYANTEPLYYQSAPYSQTNYAPAASTYQGSGGKSSASFSIHVNGKEHGHSYSHDHKV